MVVVKDIQDRLPRRLHPDEEARVEVLIQDAKDLIAAAFGRAGKDLQSRLSIPWFQSEYKRVIREMVSAPVLVGVNAGMRSASSTTGQESDSVTFADVGSVSWGGVTLTDRHRADLGLPAGGQSRGRFPPAPKWPERILP